jgi:hypothetical protein
VLISGLLALASSAADTPSVVTYRQIDGPPHHYTTSKPRDRFTRVMATIEKDPRLDRSSEKTFLTSFLRILDVPISSQLLVFSTTSLQLRFISPSNPRAIYFNEDIYVGYIPGGRMEIVALDPELGAIFYIFDIPRERAPIRYERSDRCMNCHSTDDTGYVPGLVVKSVVPAPSGGSLDGFRLAQSGHEIPFSERFGGWHVTGRHDITNHWGNVIGRYVNGEITRIPNPPGVKYQWSKYPAESSDILPHLLLEHQVGFVNRVVEAAYRARTALFVSGEKLSAEQTAELDEQARIIARYLLFAGEAPLPGAGVEPDASYQAAFLAGRRLSADGLSLKDLNLKSRLFNHRCSYMIYSPVFERLPVILKSRIYRVLGSALKEENGDKEFAYLTAAERKAVRQILTATLKDLPAGW